MARVEKDGKTVYVPSGFTLKVPSGFGNNGEALAEYDSWEEYVWVEIEIAVHEVVRNVLKKALTDNPAMQKQVKRVESDGLQGLQSWVLSGTGDSAAESVCEKLHIIASNPAQARALAEEAREARMRQLRDDLDHSKPEDMRRSGNA